MPAFELKSQLVARAVQTTFLESPGLATNPRWDFNPQT